MKNKSKEVILDLDVPGFEKKDIKVKVDKNSISVNAEKKQEKKIQKKDFFHQKNSLLL
jgi:HSP20 family molecular chaperone IbpA